MTKEVLCMYDVRGIQDYIFRTNRMRDIQGASNVVKNIIERGLSEVAKLHFSSPDVTCLLRWKEATDCTFLQDAEVRMEVVFIGGGNAFVLFRDGDEARGFNQSFSKWILERTYSLQLAFASVERTETYYGDYQRLHQEMQRVKSQMTMAIPFSGFPMIRRDVRTGLPIAKKVQEFGEEQYHSRESEIKSKARGDVDAVKFLDDMVDEKGKDSMLGVVHIDGNSMGTRIAGLMQQEAESSYLDAVMKIRAISKRISSVFESTYERMEGFLDEALPVEGKKEFSLRGIILAGDDITFVCNAKYALSLSEFFLKEVAKHSLDDHEPDKYRFSACAGIAYMNSHYPFSDAYQVAEECCASAKTRAKAHRSEQGMVGSYIDFQLVHHISSGQLEHYRKHHYWMADGRSLIQRPYAVTTQGYGHEGFSFEHFRKAHRFISRNNNEAIPRSWLKKFRNTYSKGSSAIELLAKRAKSRGFVFPESMFKEHDGMRAATYYDALEMMEYYEDLAGSLGKRGVADEEV